MSSSSSSSSSMPPSKPCRVGSRIPSCALSLAQSAHRPSLTTGLAQSWTEARWTTPDHGPSPVLRIAAARPDAEHQSHGRRATSAGGSISARRCGVLAGLELHCCRKKMLGQVRVLRMAASVGAPQDHKQDRSTLHRLPHLLAILCRKCWKSWKRRLPRRRLQELEACHDV